MDDLFGRFDTNKDGLLDWNEIWTSMEPIEAKVKENLAT